MEPIIAVMLMLGCDHSMMVCREMPEPVRQYSSVQSCEADVETRIRDIDSFPVAVAQCLEVQGGGRDARVSIDWQLDRTGNLYAEAVISETGPRVVSGELVMASAERFLF
ncbi:hypothetical protein [Oricola sp.]|uniref:hypothetical protein n=1 Tax=Oricola sp. TaxID=1979950 RepID=UPI003BAD3E83